MNAVSNPSYNYDNFRSDMMFVHMQFDAGPGPGSLAPNIDLPTVAGGRFELQSFFGQRMVLIEFGSITCPMASAASGCLKRLYHDFKKQLELVSVYVREAHPSESYPQHRNVSQKMQHASDWVRMGDRPWTVAVDTQEGGTHLAYGPLPNCAYLIDRTGRVAYRALWAGQEHLLRMRIEELLRRDATGEASVNMGQQESLVSC